jgi:hypothetical protein
MTKETKAIEGPQADVPDSTQLLCYLTPSEAVFDDADEAESLRAQLAEAHAVLKEQEDLLFAIGPITCRNGIKHTRIDRCLYCEIERMRPVVVVAEDQARKCEAEVTVMHFTERGREFLTACLETVKAFRDYEAKDKP